MPGNGTQGRAVASKQAVCPVCYNLNEDYFPESNPPTKFPTLSCEFKDIARAAKKGCQTCYAIKVAMLLMMGLDPRDRKIRFGLCIVSIELSDIVRVVALATDTNRQRNLLPTRTTFEMFTKPETPSPWPAFGEGTGDVTPKLHSRRRKKMLQEWIEVCTKFHPICGAMLRGIPASVPRRYLDLGKNPRNGVKLVDVSADPGAYVAIIHGVTGPLPVPCSLTTVENLKDRQRRIEWWQIPVALQEALVVAHEQGVRYAWIPDFCILHGDEEDQNWHLSREDAIFRLAHFTIALTDTTDLKRSNFRGASKTTAEGAHERGGSKTIQISHRGRSYPIHVRPSMHWSHWLMAECVLLQPMETKNHLFALEHNKMGLLRHAPSFQRMLLSPRVLHLHRSEMAWYCLNGSSCECADQHYMRTHEKFKHPLPRHKFHALRTKKFDEIPGQLLQLYMNLPLSQPDQRLAHMVGMLRYITLTSGKQSCAAISTSSPRELAEELLWNLSPSRDPVEPGTRPVRRSHRHHTPRIPTWSWASMVLADHQVIQGAASILSFLILGPFVLSPSFRFWDTRWKEAPGSSPDGMLASEYQLEVSANVMPGRVGVAPEQYNIMREADELRFTPEAALGDISYPPVAFRPDCHDLLSSVNSSQGPVDFYFMSLGEMGIKDPPNFGGADVGLVLRPAQRDYAVGFERVGVFAIPTGRIPFADLGVQRLILV